MRSPLLRCVVALLLVLGLGTATTGHRDPVDPATPGGRLEAHHHGPHSPCPEGEESHCLACAAQALFAQPPAVNRLPLPSPDRADLARAEGASRSADRPAASGRSPPALLRIA